MVPLHFGIRDWIRAAAAPRTRQAVVRLAPVLLSPVACSCVRGPSGQGNRCQRGMGRDEAANHHRLRGNCELQAVLPCLCATRGAHPVGHGQPDRCLIDRPTVPRRPWCTGTRRCKNQRRRATSGTAGMRVPGWCLQASELVASCTRRRVALGRPTAGVSSWLSGSGDPRKSDLLHFTGRVDVCARLSGQPEVPWNGC